MNPLWQKLVHFQKLPSDHWKEIYSNWLRNHVRVAGKLIVEHDTQFHLSPALELSLKAETSYIVQPVSEQKNTEHKTMTANSASNYAQFTCISHTNTQKGPFRISLKTNLPSNIFFNLVNLFETL